MAGDDKECIKLTLKALLEVVQTGGKNVELAIMKRGQPLKVGFELCGSIFQQNLHFDIFYINFFLRIIVGQI